MRVAGRPPGREQQPHPLDAGEQRIVESRINQGMITTIDSSDIDPAALQYAKNIVVRFDKTKRRSGSVLLLPLKPNSEPVLKLAFIKLQNGTPNTIRMTPGTLHTRGESHWYPILIPTPLTGTVIDRFTTADILDKFIFSNNGADPIQTVDFDTGKCTPLGNAPHYRYVCGFFNRAIGFARKDESEVEVGWSADADPTQWDSNANPSAGSAPLLDSPADLSDFITGGLSFSNVMIVFREKSIWLATKQPIQQDPFYFYSAVPGIGCNVPYSIQIIDKGSVAWLDQATRSVYAYTPGNVPEQIDTQITKSLFADLQDPGASFAAYDKLQHEYTIYIPVNGGVVRGWTFNFITRAWAFSEYLDVTSANDTELTVGGKTIDELIGTIDSLQGTINSLSGSTSTIAARSYGRSDGTLAEEDDTVDNDASETPFESEIRSKTFVVPEFNVNICRLLIEYQASRAAEITLEYSKDNGVTWVFNKTVTCTVFTKPQLIKLKRLIYARRFIWRLRWSSGDVEILSYEVYVTPSGESSK